jgi:serine/threonine-protein kinase
MGTVYEAIQLRLNKRVAVKLMSRDLAANSEALARFRREAEITSLLGHAHLVAITDFGTAPTGEPYLVMEYLEGEDLERRIERSGCLSAETTVHVARQVASALSATHAKGVVHRDLKPANIFLLQMEGEPDFVKVLDFGISKVKAARTKLTRALSVLGTPNYMSPEQATGMVDEIDHRTDQWALACIAWEMLSGRPPFVAEELSALLYQIINLDPQPLSKRVPNLVPGVEPVLRRALAKQMGDRFPSVVDFVRSLELAALGRPADGTPAPVLVSRSAGAHDPVWSMAPTIAGDRERADERLDRAGETRKNAAARVTTFSQTAGEQSTLEPTHRFRRSHAIAVAVGVILIGGSMLVLRPHGVQQPVTSRAATAASVTVIAPLSPSPMEVAQPAPPRSVKSAAKPTEPAAEAAAKRKAPKKHPKRFLIQEL